jgi:hypothetical protein
VVLKILLGKMAELLSELNKKVKIIFYGIALSNVASEINSNYYKGNISKGRSSLLPYTVCTLITVQQSTAIRSQSAAIRSQSAAIRSQRFYDFKYEAMKCKLSNELVASRDNILTKFMNYKEGWKFVTIQTKNAANEIMLNDKYQHIYIYDADTDEIKRVVNCEWSTANRPCRYTVIAQFIAKKSEDIDARDKDEEYVSYFSNDELYLVEQRS